jgi:hypothetical protein
MCPGHHVVAIETRGILPTRPYSTRVDEVSSASKSQPAAMVTGFLPDSCQVCSEKKIQKNVKHLPCPHGKAKGA